VKTHHDIVLSSKVAEFPGELPLAFHRRQRKVRRRLAYLQSHRLLPRFIILAEPLTREIPAYFALEINTAVTIP
jgi:hypothetical protein